MSEVRPTVGTARGRATVVATGASRVNMALPHLMGAARYARELARLEAAHDADEFGSFYDEMRSHATAAVMMSIASLESFCNEHFADAHRHFEPASLEMWKRIAKDVDRATLLDKADWFLFFRGKAALDRGRRPTQDVDLLIRLRNALVHFRPEWSNAQREHADLSKALGGRFRVPKWLAAEKGVFPMAWAGHGCAEWAVASCKRFMEEFEAQAGLPSVVPKWAHQLNTSWKVPTAPRQQDPV